MKRKTTRFLAAMLSIALILITSACSPSPAKLEQELGVSFDNIICQYSTGAIIWDDDDNFYEDFSTNITFYADNTVRLWTSESSSDTNAIAETTAQITEEQKNALLEAIRENNLLAISHCGTYDVMGADWGRDSHWGYITFYDADGNDVHTCGGLQPDHPDYNAVAALIREYFPYLSSELVKLRAQTAEIIPATRLCEFIHSQSKERSISCKKYVFTLYCGYDRYSYDGLEYDIDLETFYTMLPNGDLEIKVAATGYTKEYDAENRGTVTNEISKTYSLSEKQTNELIELFKKFFNYGTLLPADQNPNDVSIFLNWYGHIKLYDENGENNFNHFMTSFILYEELAQKINNMLPTFELNEFKDAAAIPVAEEILLLVGPQE